MSERLLKGRYELRSVLGRGLATYLSVSPRAWLATLAALVAVGGLAIVLLGRAGPGGAWRRARRDAFGDPLPRNALGRLGSVRLRHGGPVRAVAFTPDRAAVLSASGDGSVSLWNAANGEELRRFELGEPATSLALSPDGSRALVGVLRSWSARLFELGGSPIARLLPAGERGARSAAVTDVAWSRDGRTLATRTLAAVDLWSGADGRHRRRLPGCGDGRGLAFVGSAPSLLVGCSDRTTRLFDVASGSELRRLELSGSPVPLSVSPDGRLVADPNNRVQLVELASGTRTRLDDPELHLSSASAFCFSPDGTLAVAGLASGKLVVWDVATGARRLVLDAHVGPVNAVAVSRDAARLASGGEDGALSLFELPSGRRTLGGNPHRGAVAGVDFLPGTEALLSAGADAALVRWERDGRATTLHTLDRPATAVFALSSSRIAALELGRVHGYDVASGREVTSAALPRDARGSVAVAAQRGLLAVGAASTLELVDLASGSRRSFPVPRPEEALAFSPDGSVVASLRDEAEPLGRRSLVLRDAASGHELGLTPHGGGPYPFRCRSADGSYFGFGGGLWRLGSDPKARLEPHGWPGRAVGPCAVSPDGRWLALARDAPDTVEVSELVRGAAGQPELRHVGTLSGHRGPVTSLAFAPDSRTLASGGADGSLLVWEVSALGPSAENPPPRRPSRAPRLRLSFDDGIEGPGLTPVRVPAASPLQLVPGLAGRALRPATALAFPETRALELGDEYTVSVAFQMRAFGLRPESPIQSILSSELVTLDVRDGGKAYLFLHFMRQAGHASVDLTPWLDRVKAGRWYRVAVSSRRADGLLRVCVDGVCGSGPPGKQYSDRLGELTLARSALSNPFAGEIDELAIYDRMLSDDEMAQAAGLARAAPLPTPTPPPTPTPLPRPPVEQEPLPREGLPEGRDVSAQVNVEERAGFTVYRFAGPLARMQPLDLELGMGAVWVGTSRGLLRHDPRTGSFRLRDETAGLPGEWLDEIAVVGGQVVADVGKPSGPHSVLGLGPFAFDLARRSWAAMKDIRGSVSDLWADGSTLWVGTDSGAESHDLATGAVRRFTRGSGELVHDAVRAVRRHGETVAFAAAGDYVRQARDFAGGGVTLWDRRGNRFRSYAKRDGLARDHACDVFLDEREVFVAHWEEELGLSRIDLGSGAVEVWPRSTNGIDLGGVVLAGERDILWIGQQGGLVRLERATRQATMLREQDGLPGYIVSGIVMSEDSVWASLYSFGQDGVRSAGLVRFNRR